MFTGELISCWWGPVQAYRQPVSFCTGALVCCGASRKVISCGEDFLGVLPIFHTKWPEHIFHSCHLQIGWLLLDKVEKEIGKWVPVCFLLQSHRTQRLGQTFFFPPPPPPLFKYINLPELITASDKVALESTESKRQISDRLSAIPCLQLPGRKRLQVLPADSKSLG